MHIQKIFFAVLLIPFAIVARAQETFDAHVARAGIAATTPEGRDFGVAFLRENFGKIQSISRECFEKRENVVSYIYVVDVQSNGLLSNIEVSPKNTRTECIAKKIGALRSSISIPQSYKSIGFPFSATMALSK